MTEQSISTLPACENSAWLDHGDALLSLLETLYSPLRGILDTLVMLLGSPVAGQQPEAALTWGCLHHAPAPKHQFEIHVLV